MDPKEFLNAPQSPINGMEISDPHQTLNTAAGNLTCLYNQKSLQNMYPLGVQHDKNDCA